MAKTHDGQDIKGKKVKLRNDSPGVRMVHDVNNNPVIIQPGATVEAEIPNSVVEMYENATRIAASQRRHDILRVEGSDAARELDEQKKLADEQSADTQKQATEASTARQEAERQEAARREREEAKPTGRR